MLIYHGSPHKFESFDYSRIGDTATSRGRGFYFAGSPEVARRYADNGFLYTAEFLGKKSVSATRKTITVDELSRLLQHIHSVDGYLHNYGDIGYYGFNRVLREAVGSLRENKNDMDIIGEMCNIGGNTELVLRSLYTLLGRDHMKQKTEWSDGKYIYVLFVPEAFRFVSVQRVTRGKYISF